jgi:hypothetical protein
MFMRDVEHYAYFEWKEKGRRKGEERGEGSLLYFNSITCPILPPMAKMSSLTKGPKKAE